MSGLSHSYFPDPKKNSKLVVLENKIQQVQKLLHGMGFKVVTGSYYLGSSIEDAGNHDTWIGGKLRGWEVVV